MYTLPTHSASKIEMIKTTLNFILNPKDSWTQHHLYFFINDDPTE